MLFDVLSAIEHSSIAAQLRGSRWVYPIVNASHIASIGMLIGSIGTYDLRVLGVIGRSIPVKSARRLLLPVAAAGLACAILTGFLLFSVKASEYAANPAFQAKLVLLTAALANILWARQKPASQLTAALSLFLWFAVIVSGRLIGFL